MYSDPQVAAELLDQQCGVPASSKRDVKADSVTPAFVREKKPEVNVRVVADLLPKEANINVEAGEAFVQLWKKISDGLGDELADHLDDDPSLVVH